MPTCLGLSSHSAEAFGAIGFPGSAPSVTSSSTYNFMHQTTAFILHLHRRVPFSIIMSHEYLVLLYLFLCAATQNLSLSPPTGFFHMLISKPLLKDPTLCPTLWLQLLPHEEVTGCLARKSGNKGRPGEIELDYGDGEPVSGATIGSNSDLRFSSCVDIGWCLTL